MQVTFGLLSAHLRSLPKLTPSLFPALTTELQELHEAAAGALTHVHARGDTVAAQLIDLRRRVDQIISFGVEEGAALALSLAHLQTKENLTGLDSRPPADFEGDLEELRKAHMTAAGGIAAEINSFAVISRVFEMDD